MAESRCCASLRDFALDCPLFVGGRAFIESTDKPERIGRSNLWSAVMENVCPICGETSPEPSEICIPRLIKTAKVGEPCSYSREGYQRFAEEVGEEKAELINAIGASGSLDDGGR